MAKASSARLHTLAVGVAFLCLVALSFSSSQQRCSWRALGQSFGYSTVGLSPTFLTQAADVTSANFHTSVMNTFKVPGMFEQPLPSFPNCIITYADLVLQSFSTTGFTVSVLPAGATQNSGTVQFAIDAPAFVLITEEFIVGCTYTTPVGIFTQTATGTIQGSWSSSAPLVVHKTQTQSGGSVNLSNPVLLTPITMAVTYSYSTGGPPSFTYDVFVNHHFTDVVTPAVNAALMAMFGNTGPPILLVQSFMNDVFVPWSGACSTNQQPPNENAANSDWLLINEQPACNVVNLTALPLQEWTQVTQTPSMMTKDAVKPLRAAECHASHTQEHFIKVPGHESSLKLIFSNCTHCTTSNGQIVGVSCNTAFEGSMTTVTNQRRHPKQHRNPRRA